MTTPFYGETPGSDVEPGNRVDSASAPDPMAQPLMRPMSPTPNPWAEHGPFALRGLMFGMVAAAAIFAGLALLGIALAWSPAITPSLQAALMVAGGALVAAAIGYIASARPECPRSEPA